jgi:hypothetical protein
MLILEVPHHIIHTNHIQNNKNNPTLWDTIAHGWDHMLNKTGTTKTEAQQFPSK